MSAERARGGEAAGRAAAARTGGDRRCDEPRGRQLQDLLEGDDLLEPARTARLPARLRPRPLGDSRRRSRRRPLRAVRRHRDGRHRGDLLQRPAGDVRHLRQAPLPEHIRSDPRCPGRRRRAGQRRDALDRAAVEHLRLLPAAGDDRLRARPRSRDAAGAGVLPTSPPSASPASASRWRRSSPRSTSSTT